MNKVKHKLRPAILALAICVAALICACAIYVCDHYRADSERIDAYISCRTVEADMSTEGIITFKPEDASVGLIFYPGGKVEYTAYIPLMSALAESGVLCIIVKMPLNLAVLDINAAKGFTDEHPSVESWYIGGHSLGGAMAAAFLADNSEDFEGLILLGAYSTKSITLPVLSVYGSEDGIMDREKYEDCRSNIASSLTEKVIDGGCHSFFGMYGEQRGDGTPTISNEEQIRLTAEEIIKFIEQGTQYAEDHRKCA